MFAMVNRIIVYLILFLLDFSQNKSFRVTDHIFFDVDVEGQFLGRITIGLFGDTVPATCLNFKQIATNGINGKTYEGSKFHTVIKRFLIQGGDIINNNGSGSISIYGKHFEDENFEVKHASPGIVSMANAGPNINGCQFFITTIATPWLDGQNVAFGKVVKGQDVVHRIELLETDTDNRPLKNITIIRSGFIQITPYYESNEPYEITLWTWLKAGWIPLSFSVGILLFFNWFMVQLK